MKCETCDGSGEVRRGEPVWPDRIGGPSHMVTRTCPDCSGRGYRLHGAQLQEARRVMAMAIECVCSAFRWVPSNEAMASDYMDTARQLADRALRICGIDPDEFK